MSPRDVLARAVWFAMLPLYLLNAVIWLIGKLLEAIGDALQEGANVIRDQITAWARLTFSVPAHDKPEPKPPAALT